MTENGGGRRERGSNKEMKTKKKEKTKFRKGDRMKAFEETEIETGKSEKARESEKE